MKYSDVKTREQFYKFADVWYQRVHKLAVIWQDDNETDKRKWKAFSLWSKMANRVLLLVGIAIKLNQPKPKNK